ncbi:hypothetical protein A2875_03105 [Candidatus Gottesmanbacteria bacterium RIFCSPHIGHO2_01_FULL_46_14]|uniref:Glycosyltransferase RgtA/B/C/D-like domain-containing protein n=2 Tax=Candidatus Gottesmaniibacteriota TaxID=1752720 RepID=A0A1F5ZRG2_9BACT|nr:MAG: hypothetical protein A2875_03105 [Candidatus Gottesmanbacteria bacterium RIFCSPHIGHO2_01_FULL_46_14]OGG30347.1 MAG: hypothetical protein A2971_02000 [Candidatus Gottesmanbacteria bacterium RIFCSPLOWO2_01_FULL_46_21]
MVLLIIILVHLTFLLSLPIHIWPELSFLPWLVSKGLVPYRDFFDNHGFLLSYALTIIAGNTFYILTQLLSTILVYKILRNHLMTVFFVLVSVFVSENYFWYEGVITVFYLLTYRALTQKSSPVLIGFLVGLASFIKPTAVLILLPIGIYKKSLVPVLVTGFMWVVVCITYWIIGGLSPLISDLFMFNQFLFKYYEGLPIGDKRILVTASGVLLLSLYTAIRSRATKSILPFTFMLVSLVFLRLTYGKEHLVPMATFFVLFIGLVFTSASRRYKLFVGLGLLLLSIALTRQINYRYSVLAKERDQSKRVATLANVAYYLDKKFYVFGEFYELYMIRDQLPPTYFPIHFQIFQQFFPDYEQQIINRLESEHIEIIVIPQPIPSNFRNLIQIQTYINNNYKEVNEVSSGKIYRKN